MFIIKEIEPDMTYEIRYKVLRPHQALEDCKYEDDTAESTFHLGAFHDDKLASVVSFYMEDNINLDSNKQYHLRAMATLPEFRMMGAGRELISYAEKIILSKGYDLLWCNGRTAVQGYYESLGFKPFGEIFDYPPIGLHIVMYKRLGKKSVEGQ